MAQRTRNKIAQSIPAGLRELQRLEADIQSFKDLDRRVEES
jgi:hypothetical protein